MSAFQEYLDTASLLPAATLERLTSPSVWWEVTPAKLGRAAALRSRLATTEHTDTPLSWLNEVLEAAASSQAGAASSDMLRHVLAVVTSCRAPATAHTVTAWLLELMGQISAQLRRAAPGPAMSPAIVFLVDVFAVTVICLAEVDSLAPHRAQLAVSRAARLGLVPAAVGRVCRHQGRVAAQLADWCSQLYSNQQVASQYRDTFGQALRVFKDSPNWKEASMWGKLVILSA